MSYHSSSARIAFYLPALEAGGMERVTLILADALARRGWAVDIVLEHGIGGYFDRIPAGVRRFVLAQRNKWPAYARLVRRWPREGLAQVARAVGAGDRYVPLARLDSLVSYFETERPAVVFAAHGRIPPLALWARALSAFAPRIAIIEHSTFSRWLSVFENDRREYRQLRYRLSLMHRLYPQAEAIVGVSDGVSDDLAQVARLPRDRIKTIYNPVVTEDLTALARQPVSHPWFMDDAIPVVLAVGRLVQEKDFATLIDAFARLLANGQRARLVLLGEGEQRAALRAQAERLGVMEHLDMPGWIDNPYAYMSRAALFVLSSLFEGLPVALIEALACGCPVVSTRCPSGPEEILDHGRYGRLTPVGNAKALADAMAETLANPPAREALKQRAADFDVARAADAYQALIDDLIDRGRRRD